MGCLISLLLALACLCPTWAAVRLGMRGDLELNLGRLVTVRLWITPAETGRSLALSSTRVTESGPTKTCQQTRVRFVPLGLRRAPVGASYCSCTGEGGSSSLPGACPP